MNKLTFYEQVGIVIPGSVFLFGLLLFFPVLQTVFTKDGVSFGELGIFVLVSYAAGHLIAAVGNAIVPAATSASPIRLPPSTANMPSSAPTAAWPSIPPTRPLR